MYSLINLQTMRRCLDRLHSLFIITANLLFNEEERDIHIFKYTEYLIVPLWPYIDFTDT